MLARRQIRLAVVDSLKRGMPNVTIESPGNISTPPERLPAILVRNGSERKTSITKSMPEFTTTLGIEIEARVKGGTPAAAQDAIEELGNLIEWTLFTDYELIRIINQIASVDTSTEVSSEGKEHFAGIRMSLAFEVPEMFDPTSVREYPALTAAGVHVDTAAPYDANGTYASPAFPDSVLPAPRTSGPDGRDEGYVEINLS